jgi:hypothetical protein
MIVTSFAELAQTVAANWKSADKETCLTITVDYFTPLLLNSARCIVLFQNFVVLWKIHMSQNIILPADASHQDALNGVRVAYANFYNTTYGCYDRVKDEVEVTKNS